MVEEMFENRKEFHKAVIECSDVEIQTKKGVFGYYIGDDTFEKEIRRKFDRRYRKHHLDHPHMRRGQEEKFLRSSTIKRAFLNFYSISDVNDLLQDGSYKSKRRIDILVKLLRDKGGLNYKQISKELGLKYSSISKRYLRAQTKGIPLKLRNL
jgi:hypothetical protein